MGSVRKSVAKKMSRQLPALQKFTSHNILQMVFICILLFFASHYNFNFSLTEESFGSSELAPKEGKSKMGAIFAALHGSFGRADTKAVQVKNDNRGNTYSNVSYWAGKRSTSDEKKMKQLNYVTRFGKIAQTEMNKYGIPASIILAQGILESNAGQSSLAEQNNNHFGIKCFARNCKKGHCSNYTDDSHKDFFRAYASPWESYRAHSIMIVNNQYRKLLKYGTRDYKNWAYGLKNLGYATDDHYAESLIRTIEDLDLHAFDR
jgi:flagellum-specific peptidoglycan hydrolase FlgJ